MKEKSISDCTILNNGIKMPWFGLGVWLMDDGLEVENAVSWALEYGYKSIDTAALYANEKGVGNAIETCRIKREELFITSKVWNSDQGYESTLKAFSKSLHKLKLDYLDLYLIHWPVNGKFSDTWKALEKLYEDKLVRAIGVSNFHISHLKKILNTANVIPSINQVELHPYLNQIELRKFCKDNNIQIEAWSPIMQGNAGKVPELVKLGNKYGKSPSQIVLRWDLQKEIVTIPKSIHKNRIVENAQIFDFELDEEDINIIDSLNRNYRYGPNPDRFNF